MSEIIDNHIGAISTPELAYHHYITLLVKNEIELSFIKKELRETYLFDDIKIRETADLLVEGHAKKLDKRNPKSVAIVALILGTIFMIIGCFFFVVALNMGIVIFWAALLVSAGIAGVSYGLKQLTAKR